jgi:hypothetical protein
MCLLFVENIVLNLKIQVKCIVVFIDCASFTEQPSSSITFLSFIYEECVPNLVHTNRIFTVALSAVRVVLILHGSRLCTKWRAICLSLLLCVLQEQVEQLCTCWHFNFEEPERFQNKE